MSDVTDAQLMDEMRSMIDIASGGKRLGETTERALWRAHRFLNIPISRINSYWYRKVIRPLATDLINSQRRIALTQAETNKIRAEIQRLRGFDVSNNNDRDGAISPDNS